MLEQFKMEVITIESSAFSALIDRINVLEKRVLAELDRNINPYLTTKDVQLMLKKSENWVTQHKYDLGCSKRTGTLLFKRKDIEAYIDGDYFIRSKK